MKPNSLKIFTAMRLSKEELNQKGFEEISNGICYHSLSELTHIHYRNIGKYLPELIELGLVFKDSNGLRLTEKGRTINLENLNSLESKSDNNNSIDKDIIKILIQLMANNHLDIPKEISESDNLMERIMTISEELNNE